jgi:hypothetical protein
VSVAVTVGQYRAGGGRSFSVPVVGHEKCKPFPSQLTASVCRGTGSLLPTKQHRLTTTGNQSSRVSGACGNNDCCNSQHVIGYEKG